jgi:hypothetical protein
MQTARYINVTVWFYLLVSGFLDTVVVPRGSDYWTEKVNQMFSLTGNILNGPYMARKGIYHPRFLVHRRYDHTPSVRAPS